MKIEGTKSADTLNGTEDDDVITGLGSGDTLRGGAGNDRLDGGVGGDTMFGGAGDDRLDGGTGSDTMFGGAGDDVYIVDFQGDNPREILGEGNDTVETTRTTYTLSANSDVENLIFTGTEAFTGNGNTLNNVIVGAAGNDTLNGNAGNDTLIGNAGDDTLSGGLGDDILDGGAGDDILDGGAGDDRFIFGADSGTDEIIAFGDSDTNQDVIEFDSSVFANFAAVQGAMAQVGDDVVITAPSLTDTITLRNVTLGNLGPDDFDFLLV